MIEGQSIICFAHDWIGDPTSKTHIMRILSKRNRILWVNSIAMRRPSASGRDLRRLLAKLRNGLHGCTRIHDNFYVWDPLALPFPGVPIADALNTAIISRLVRYFGRRLGLNRPILWSFLPNVHGLVGRLNERLVIYHCVDEYSAFSGVARDSLQRIERALVTRADLVFTSSEQLCRERQPFNPRTFFVSHGVDAQHFGKALAPDTLIPDDIKGIRPPIVGFFGLIADWLDLELLRHLAVTRPTWSLVLVGKSTTDISALARLPNVHFVGQRPYESLPGYCKAFAVGIIPFRISDLTQRANPLKLREYLAAGLPVVSTDLPEVRKYANLIRLAVHPEEFAAGIQASLEEQTPALAMRRATSMTSESWDERVREMSSHIEALL